jgi:hypothetical protein
LLSAFQVVEGDGAVGLAEQSQSPGPLGPAHFKSAALSGKPAVTKTPSPGFFQRPLMDAPPRGAQAQVVFNASAREHLTNDIHSNTVKIFFLGAVLTIDRHGVWREVFGHQGHALARVDFSPGPTRKHANPARKGD